MFLKSPLNIVGLISVIFVFWIFYYTFGILHYSGYNSDLAIHALMAEDFNFSSDWYFWRQNRLGSLIPLLASFFTLFGLSGLVSITIVQFILLSASFLFISSLLKHKWLFLPVLLLLFFPHSEFKNQVICGHPFLAQIFFLSALLWATHSEKVKEGLKPFLIPFLALGAIWSSEISIASIIALSVIYWKNILATITKKRWIILMVISVLGAKALQIAKSNSFKNSDFNLNFISIDAFAEGMGGLYALIKEAILFGSNKPFNSLLFYVFLLIAFLLFWNRKSLKMNKPSRFFLWSTLLSFGLVVFSNWWSFAEYPIRYFIPSFLNLCLFLVFLFDGSELSSTKKYIAPYALSICVALSGIYLLRNFDLGSPARADIWEMKEITKKGDFGIIGSYWNTYAIDALSSEIETTPYRPYARRYKRGVERAFQNDSIMFIGNTIFPTLPDTLPILETDHTLIRISNPDTIGSLYFAYYRDWNIKDKTAN